MIYLNSMEYIKENPMVIDELFDILINNDAINTVTHTLGILILICDYLKGEGVDMVIHAAQKFAKNNGSKVFQELVLLINESNIDIKINTITLIYYLIAYSERDKVEII
jgi:hypothetical protein